MMGSLAGWLSGPFTKALKELWRDVPELITAEVSAKLQKEIDEMNAINVAAANGMLGPPQQAHQQAQNNAGMYGQLISPPNAPPPNFAGASIMGSSMQSQPIKKPGPFIWRPAQVPPAGALGVQSPYDVASDHTFPIGDHFENIVKAHKTMAKVYEFLSAQISMDLFGEDKDAKYVYERILQLGYREFVMETTQEMKAK